MLKQKLIQSTAKSKSGIKSYDHYVAIDWALENMAIAHMTQSDEKPGLFEGESDISVLKKYLSSLKGRTLITFEETGSAQWLYLELLGHAERILVCEPFHNKLLNEGPKTDKIDAGKLCELLRAGMLKEVYHSGSAIYELRTLVSGYDDVVKAGVRSLNQKEALERDHRNKGKDAEFISGILDKSIEFYRPSKKEYEKRFKKFCRVNKMARNQDNIPGIGMIGAVKIIASVVDGRRFPYAGKYYSYCGLIKHEKISGKRKYGRRKPWYSRALKSVYKTAARAALKGNNAFRHYYDHLLGEGVAQHNAEQAVARYIAQVSYGMLKSGHSYDPNRFKEIKLKIK